MTRPTFLGTNRALQQRLSAAFNRFSQSADQVASNRAFTRPSQDPVAAGQAALLQERLDHLDAVGKSADDAMARLNIADAKLSQAGDSYNRVRELLLEASNGTVDDGGRGAIAEEVRQIRDGLVALANSEYLGLPLFAGRSGDAAVVYDGGTSTWQFNGAPGDTIERRISPTETLRVNVTASEAFQTGATDLFTTLDDIITALGTNDQTTIRASLDTMDDLRESLFRAHAAIGAAANRTETALNRNSATSIAVENQLSLVRDVDMAEAITRQSMLQTAYEAALQITGRTMNLSIMDFLR